ncbi:MAG: hypothetical protein JNM56_04510 [Planctomycetia bacterium]|nr:hypothetical protein [Planctomycetia bacterium]
MSMHIGAIDVDIVAVRIMQQPKSQELSVTVCVEHRTTKDGLDLNFSIADTARLERLLAVAVARIEQIKRDAIQRN